MLAVETVGLEKAYPGGRRALAGIGVNLPQGTAFGLIGPNGAGKTTFIKCLLDIVRPSAGWVRIFGEPPDSPAVRRRIGYLPERMQFPAHATPIGFIESIARLKGCDPVAVDPRDLLARVGASDVAHRKIGGLSKGTRRRVGLAAALIGSPDLMILDEPTDGIDPLGRVCFRKILIEERDRGCTIVLNSHLLAEAELLCDRVAILCGGTIVEQGAVSELCRARGSWTVQFAGANERRAHVQALVDAGFVRRAAGAGSSRAWIFEGSAVTLNHALDEVRARGVLLTALGPEQRSLEEVLSRALARVN
jgi:ABC-2 type transport system ATP-binding protein